MKEPRDRDSTYEVGRPLNAWNKNMGQSLRQGEPWSAGQPRAGPERQAALIYIAKTKLRCHLE